MMALMIAGNSFLLPGPSCGPLLKEARRETTERSVVRMVVLQIGEARDNMIWERAAPFASFPIIYNVQKVE